MIARRYGTRSDFLFLGRGISYPIALEGALKLKEISYIHAEGYAAGEMKHGPIALIDESMPVVVLAPQGPELREDDVEPRRGRAREGKVIAIATRGDHEIGALADEVISDPRDRAELQPILTVLPRSCLRRQKTRVKAGAGQWD